MATLVCRSCQVEHPDTEPIWQCSCGGLLDLEFESSFPIKEIEERSRTLWRYREALPIEQDENIVSLGEGFTPMIPMEIEGFPVHMKHDHIFLTGSFKDRGASIMLSKVRELGIDHVIEDSSGNAGCAIAAYSAEADVQCEIYTPENIAPEKASQIEVVGGTLNRIPGGRKATADAALDAAHQTYFASHCWNPYFFHGTKTFAFEVCEQLGWKAPDVVILPVGNGTLLLGAAIGFRELVHADVIDRLPKIVGVQADQCCPVFLEYHDKEGGREPGGATGMCGESVAEGIAIPKPIRGPQILEAIRESKGSILKVTEEEIIQALMRTIERGIIIEPTSAATVAGVEQYILDNHPDPDQTIISTFTGHGSNTAEKIAMLLG